MVSVNPVAVELTALIAIGALAYFAAALYHNRHRDRAPARGVVPFETKGPQRLVELYLSLGLLLPFVNGYLVRRSWADCFNVGFGTLVATLLLGALIRKPQGPAAVRIFYVCAAVTVVWPLAGVARVVAGLAQ
jgi:hypothetical protein